MSTLECSDKTCCPNALGLPNGTRRAAQGRSHRQWRVVLSSPAPPARSKLIYPCGLRRLRFRVSELESPCGSSARAPAHVGKPPCRQGVRGDRIGKEFQSYPARHDAQSPRMPLQRAGVNQHHAPVDPTVTHTIYSSQMQRPEFWLWECK